MKRDTLISVELDEFVQACQRGDVDLRPHQALRLWRALGGRVRTEWFLQLWHREAERRAAWDGAA